MARFGVFSSVLILTAAGLGACTSQPTVSETQRTQYDTSVLRYAASKGGIPVEARGRAFNRDAGELAPQLAAGLERATSAYNVGFLSQTPADFSSPYRVVMHFDPPSGTNTADLCESAGDREATAAGGTLKVAAAFCAKDKALTHLNGRVADPGSADAPAFARLVTQIGQGLFPAGTGDFDGGGDFM